MGHRELKLIRVFGEFEEPLRGAGWHVEEHGVGQGFISRADALREQPHDRPEHLGPYLDGGPDIVERDLEQGRVDEGSGFGRSWTTVEESHLTEEATVFEDGDHGLAAIGRASRDRNPAVHDHVEIRRLVTLGEEELTLGEISVARLHTQMFDHCFRERREELGRVEQTAVGHGLTLTTDPAVGADSGSMTRFCVCPCPRSSSPHAVQSR